MDGSLRAKKAVRLDLNSGVESLEVKWLFAAWPSRQGREPSTRLIKICTTAGAPQQRSKSSARMIRSCCKILGCSLEERPTCSGMRCMKCMRGGGKWVAYGAECQKADCMDCK